MKKPIGVITIDAHAQYPLQGFAPQLKRFILYFLEMQIPMGLGALVCYLLGRTISASSNFAEVYHPGTYLFTAGDVFFLTVPVLVWMIRRGHGWQFGLEMVAAMLTPVAASIVVGELAGYAYQLWLITAMYPLMCFGMLAYMLYRHNHFTGRVANSMHDARLGGESSSHAN
jgi:hypothetical protein